MHLPESHRDLIEGPYPVCISIVSVDGQLFTAPAWSTLEGESLLVIILFDSDWDAQIHQNPSLSLLVYDPHNPLRNMEIRGRAIEMIHDPRSEYLDRLTRLYTGKSAIDHFDSHRLSGPDRPRCYRITAERIRVEGSK